MKNEQGVNELLNFLKTTSDEPINYDESAILKEYQQNNGDQSWVIKIVSILGAVLASLAFVGFILIAGLYDSEVGLILFGAVCIVGAIGVSKMNESIIIDTFCVSFYIIGCCLLAFSISMLRINVASVGMIFIAIASCTLAILTNYMLSFMSVLIINAGIITIITYCANFYWIHLYISLLALFLTYFILNESKIISTSNKMNLLYGPLRIGLICSFLSLLFILGTNEIVPIPAKDIWLSSIAIILSILYLTSKLYGIFNIINKNHQYIIYLVSILLLAPTVLSPAISGALLIVLLCFYVNDKTGFVLGIVATIYFISQYYYDLNLTLLTKSLLLFSSGILFLLFYIFINKKISEHEKV